MLTEKDGVLCPKVIDFGEVVQHRKFAENSVGTSGYIAPEIYNRSEHGREVDVYSFGIIINEIFNQEEPFHHEQQSRRLRVFDQEDTYDAADWKSDVPEVIEEMVINGERPPIAGEQGKEQIVLPHGRCFSTIANLIQDCWAHDPEDRPTFADILKTLKIFEDVLYND